MKTFMAIAIGAGYLGGVLLAVYISRQLIRSVSSGVSARAEHKKWIFILGAIFGAVALIPAIFLATVFGGNLGGSYGGIVSETIGMGEAGIPIGLATGLILVTTVTVTVATAIGAGLGSLVSIILGREPAT